MAESRQFVSATEGPLVGRIIQFARYLRANGYQIGVQEELDALKVARHASVLDKLRLRWGLRSLLCGSNDDWERFDELFDSYWFPTNRKSRISSSSSGLLDRNGQAPGFGQKGQAVEADRVSRRSGDGQEDAAEAGVRGGASARESHERRDFRRLSDADQMRAMEQLVERVAKRIRRRITRRMRVYRQGRRIHLRRTIRNSLRYGGTPLELAFKFRRRELPRLVIVLDVSRSMSLYSYLFLRFARGLVGTFKDADAFVYHTRLVRVTDALRGQNVDHVKQKLALLSMGWSGGTRIGECLKTLNKDYGQRINSRSIVIIVSDGFDTGPPAILTEQLTRIKSRARKIVWLNPLLGLEGYEPVAGGMQAALPCLDMFASAHNLESLMALESHLARM
jgi:uncharacterized protein with von Willebrand factor type A (vWA) domain